MSLTGKPVNSRSAQIMQVIRIFFSGTIFVQYSQQFVQYFPACKGTFQEDTYKTSWSQKLLSMCSSKSSHDKVTNSSSTNDSNHYSQKNRKIPPTVVYLSKESLQSKVKGCYITECWKDFHPPVRWSVTTKTALGKSAQWYWTHCQSRDYLSSHSAFIISLNIVVSFLIRTEPVTN